MWSQTDQFKLETWSVAGETHSVLQILCTHHTLCAAAFVTYSVFIFAKDAAKAPSAKPGSPVPAFHCSVVFAKDHLTLVAVVAGAARSIRYQDHNTKRTQLQLDPPVSVCLLKIGFFFLFAVCQRK